MWRAPDPVDYRPPRLRAEAGGQLGQVQAGARPTSFTRTLNVWGSSDEQARKKVRLIGEQVVKPALAEGTRGLAFTRGLLAQALSGVAGGVNGHKKGPLAVRVFEWVKGRLRYVNDPRNVELFQQLPELFRGGIGDCDDFTAALAALFTAAGIPVKARIIQLPGVRGWAHIYPVAFVDGAWRAFDATERWPAGWEFRNATRRLDLELL